MSYYSHPCCDPSAPAMTHYHAPKPAPTPAYPARSWPYVPHGSRSGLQETLRAPVPVPPQEVVVPAPIQQSRGCDFCLPSRPSPPQLIIKNCPPRENLCCDRHNPHAIPCCQVRNDPPRPYNPYRELRPCPNLAFNPTIPMPFNELPASSYKFMTTSWTALGGQPYCAHS